MATKKQVAEKKATKTKKAVKVTKKAVKAENDIEESGELTLIDEEKFEEGKSYKGSLSILPGKRMIFKGYKKRDEEDETSTRKVDEGEFPQIGAWAIYQSVHKIKITLTIDNKRPLTSALSCISRLYSNAYMAIANNFRFKTTKLEKVK